METYKNPRRIHKRYSDEYGRTAGLLTIEDVLEQIVGDIEDEYDPHDLPMIKEIGHKKYIVEALIRIEDFNE